MKFTCDTAIHRRTRVTLTTPAAVNIPGERESSRPRFDMCYTCAHAVRMSKMIQIRNVPEALHRKLKARAAIAGQSLSDYLRAEIGRVAARPTREEMLARIHSRPRVTLKTPAAVVIRKERESPRPGTPRGST